MSLDELAAAGLYDPDAPNAAERKEYLEYLLARFPLEDVIDVARNDPITDALAVLNGPRLTRLSAHEVAARTGMPLDEVVALRALLGLPVESLDAPDISPSFVDDVALYQFGAAAYGEERARAFARLVGGVTASLMEAGREMVWGPRRDVVMTELEVAIANDAAYGAAHLLADMLGHVYLEHASRDIWFEEEIRRGGVQMGVAFVDLVGSTNWTARLPEQDHAAALNRFEEFAANAAAQHGSRIVKFIGDEAMIVGRNPVAVTRAAEQLRAAICGDEMLPGARGVVGFGRVTPRGGDYFGDIVNLVGRATKETSSSALLVTTDVAAQLDPAEWTVGVPHALNLRGVAAPFEVADVELKA